MASERGEITAGTEHGSGLFRKKTSKTFNWWKLLFALLFGCLVVFIGGFGVHTFTNSSAFCSSCHEMTPEYLTYKASAHNQISCIECHTKPQLKNLLALKINSGKKNTSGIAEMPQQILETKKGAIDNQKCLHCHTKNRLVTATGDLKINHKGHIKQGISCIICHAGVVHAKIAERGLNLAKDYDKWTEESTEKLAPDKFRKPNMGTCLDCHDKVNKGETPWKDPSYRVPPPSMPTLLGSTQTVASIAEAKKIADEKTQNLILQAIGKQKRNVKISMACETCHKKVKVPSTHHYLDWYTNHGTTAIKKLNTCLGCHQDSKWVREMSKEKITSSLQDNNTKVKYVPDFAVVKTQSRTNQFCRNCHGTTPPSHVGGQWAMGHALTASSSTEAESKCYICHDKETPSAGSAEPPAPATVSCHDCHKFFEQH